MDDPGTCLWTLRKEGREVACLVRLVPTGVEIDIAYDGKAVATHTFSSGDEALEWAEHTRKDRHSRGWSQAAGGQ
jgi:hypothetical protein